MIKITLKDGKLKEFAGPTTLYRVVESIGAGLLKASAVGEVDGDMKDLSFELTKDCAINVITFDNEKSRAPLRHTTSHILAQAVKRLYPDTKIAIGPVIDSGFYYDFDMETPFTIENLSLIEKEIHKIIKEDLVIERFILDRDEAIKFMTDRKEPYKVELIKKISDQEISFYKQGEFVDLCTGPHLFSTGKAKAFKLLSIAGAYWQGCEKNKMLQRIYGTAFSTSNELEQHVSNLEEIKKRDHRKIGRDLDLFSVDEYVGNGLILWHPKLSLVREEIELYWRKEHRKRGYQYIYTPHIGLSNLWETSGHLDHFAEGMYPQISMSSKDKDENAVYYVKPMSCPFHVRVYKSKPKSYRELPVRYCELGTVYRYEKSGVLHGMLRVRGFTQDDAHIICTEEQFVQEVNNTIDFALEMNKAFGFEKLSIYLSLRDPNDKTKYIENEKIWTLAEETLESILQTKGLEYRKDVGGAKFYGPAIDMKVVDAMGREWQGTTIQLDMNLPSKFGMTYVGSDGQDYVPIMLHRTLLGSMERFVGTLIEQYAGAFPLWLSPVQVKIFPVVSSVNNMVKEIFEKLNLAGIRVEIDSRNETISSKIRDAQLEKIPYMVVIGVKEVDEGVVSVRHRKKGDLGKQKLDEFLQALQKEIEQKI
ncbi:MAG: threonine--tRNA ligase [Oligoflexia bacterium]|nr:threonine--tRNA ligase [Oligoflexia bacterium]